MYLAASRCAACPMTLQHPFSFPPRLASSGLVRLWLFALLLGALLLAMPAGRLGAQTVYGVGLQGSNNRLFSVNPATGAATNLCALGLSSVANGVSPLDGLVYYIEGGTGSNPDLRRINPATCADQFLGTTNLVGSIIRMTFCPDGRLYAASNTGTGTNNSASLYIWEINPLTGQRVRRITLSSVRVEGSGDMTCVDNGDLYILANATRGSSAYRLYRVAGSDLQTVANNGAVTATGIGTNLGLTGTPNGLTEVTNAVTGCAANINTYPCLIASTGTTNRTWGINTQNGSAASIGVTGFTLNDLSRSFPVDAQVAKARTSPAVMTQGDNLTISYTITVTNAGPGLIGGGATVTDTLNPAIFNAAAATWTCAVTNAGDANSSIDTACNAASGTGNINQTVTLAPAGVITYTLQAPVLNTFNGTATNAATMALVQNVTDPVPGNDTGDAPGTTVNAATVLTISKANTGTAIVAGTTTSYVITVANTGFADADDTAVRDADTDGLACTQVACTSAVGPGAACPPPANVTIANLQNPGPSGGIRLPDFPYGTTVTFTVTCLVENP